MTMKHKSEIVNSFTCAAISTSIQTTRTSTTAMKKTTHTDVLHDRSILHWNDENRIIPTTDKDERNKTASTKTNSTTTMIHPHKHTTRNRKELQNIAWLKRFKELKQFQMQHGHCNVPQKYPENPRYVLGGIVLYIYMYRIQYMHTFVFTALMIHTHNLIRPQSWNMGQQTTNGIYIISRGHE